MLTPEREVEIRDHAKLAMSAGPGRFAGELWLSDHATENTLDLLAEVDRLRDTTEQAKAVIQSWPCECSDEHHFARCKFADQLWSLLETHPEG